MTREEEFKEKQKLFALELANKLENRDYQLTDMDIKFIKAILRGAFTPKEPDVGRPTENYYEIAKDYLILTKHQQYKGTAAIAELTIKHKVSERTIKTAISTAKLNPLFKKLF